MLLMLLLITGCILVYCFRFSNLQYPYKGKQQKYPLRSNKQAAQPQSVTQKVSTNEHPQAKSGVTKVTKQNATAKQNPAVDVKTLKAQNTGNVSKGARGAGTVTLTQKEFDAILETIGDLARESELAKTDSRGE